MHLKPIPGFSGYYAGSDGSIWSLRANRWGLVRWLKLALHANTSGYLRVSLYRKDGTKVTKTVHVLVASAFFGPRPAWRVVCHTNGEHNDNRPVNLRYGTQSENIQDAIRQGRMAYGNGSHLSKVRDEAYVELCRLLNGGESQSRAAAAVGLSLSAVRAFKSGRIRKHMHGLLH